MSLQVGNLNSATTSGQTSIVSGAEQTQISNEILATAAGNTSNVSPTPTQVQNSQSQVSQNNLLPGASQAMLMANNMAGLYVSLSGNVSSLIGQLNNAAAVSSKLVPLFPTPNAIRVSESQASRSVRKEGI